MKKRTLSLLATVLVLSMLVGILPTFAAASAAGPSDNNIQKIVDRKGFRSEQFLRENSYQYADSDIVRAIVVLKDVPLADVRTLSTASRGETTQAEAAQAEKIAQEHATVFDAMTAERIDYDLAYEFNTLLNGFSCDVEYGKLDEIANIPGVDAVYIANTYSVPDEPQMDISNEITGNGALNGNYSGEGTVIAVLDTGINYDHDAFQPSDRYNYGPLTKADVSKAVAPGKWISEKLPFVYDYAMNDNDPAESPEGGGHGSHVSGIAAGYAETEEGEIVFSGAAPGAQIAFMKIFADDIATTNSDIYFAALEDAFRLGADVVNMSIGSDCGFTHDSELEDEVFGDIYKRLNAAGVVLCISAGNSSSMLDFGGSGTISSSKGYIGPDYTDYGVVGSPSTYDGTVSVASMENLGYPSYAITVGGYSFEFSDTSEATDPNHWVTVFSGKETDYVVVRDSDGDISLGAPEDYELEGNDVEGKIAVVQRGEIDFETKMNNAAAQGAVGCIVVNNQPGTINMAINSFTIPAVSVRIDAADVFMDAPTGKLTTPAEKVLFESDEGGLMSAFSSWGTTPDLTMKPTITSVGGNINSVDAGTDDGYVLMSGTSMASPNMAGTFANVLSWLRNERGLDKSTAAETAKALLESTAGLIYDEYGYLYSVRKQGSGLGMADMAIAAYDSGYVTDPIKELKDSETGEFEFTVTLENNSDEDITFMPSAVVMTDWIEDGENTLSTDYLYNDLTYYSIANDTALVKVTVDGTKLKDAAGITVGADKSTTVDITIELTDEGKAYLDDQGFVNGAFVEGFVQFSAEDAVPVHATFLGYNGDWTQAPALEAADVIDYQELLSYLMFDEDGQAYFQQYYELYMSVLGIEITEDMLAQMLITSDLVTSYHEAYIGYTDAGGLRVITPGIGANPLDDVKFDAAHAALSNSDEAVVNTLVMVPYLLRNVKDLTWSVVDKNDPTKVYYSSNEEYLPKSPYDSEYGWSTYVILEWDGLDFYGDPVPNNTEVTVTYDATLPYEDAFQGNAWSFDLTIDSEAPAIESAVYDAEAGTITVTASDNQYLAGIALYDFWGEELDYEAYSDEQKGESHTVTFYDEDGMWSLMGSSIVVDVVDYAMNETMLEVPLIDSELIGKPATITLAGPSGARSINTTIGESFTFPACTDRVPDDAQFIGWYNEEIERMTEDDPDFWSLYFGAYNDGMEIVVTGDATYYAVYGVGEKTTLETPLYTYYQKSDYSGDWAIVGQPYNGGYRYDDPYVLVGDGTSAQAKEYDQDIDLSTADYNEFASGEEGLRFTFAKLSDGSYTVKNAATGKYLAYVDGGITMADNANDVSTHWYIENNTDSGFGVLMSNGANRDKVLMFNDDPDVLEFEMMDQKTPLINYGGEDYYPSDLYRLYLYQRTDTEITIEYYTTKITSSSPVIPDTPYIPDPVDPDEKPTDDDKPADDNTTPEASADVFTDVEKTTWCYDAIDYVVKNGLMEGVSETSFQPNAVTTRGMVVTILYRLEGEPAVTKDIPFADVPAGEWYSDAVIWATANGIVNGYNETEFGPEDPVTREQIATILYRYADYKGYGVSDLSDLAGYTDADNVSGWASDAMGWSVAAGLVKGTSDTTLSPTDDSTRAQVATILMRFCEGIAK